MEVEQEFQGDLGETLAVVRSDCGICMTVSPSSQIAEPRRRSGAYGVANRIGSGSLTELRTTWYWAHDRSYAQRNTSPSSSIRRCS
jgi:hypothetical protein